MTITQKKYQLQLYLRSHENVWFAAPM